MTDLRFYYVSGSPFAWRVWLALEEKGLSYTANRLAATTEDLRSPEHLARSPHGKVPALEDGTTCLYESTVILEYLEERYPERSLLPNASADRAAVRIEELECILYLAPEFQRVAQQVFFRPPESQDVKVIEEATSALLAQAFRLETRLRQRGHTFVVGETLTRADTTWLPFIEILGRAKIDLPENGFPLILAWRERMRARPSYNKTYPPHWRG